MVPVLKEEPAGPRDNVRERVARDAARTSRQQRLEEDARLARPQETDLDLLRTDPEPARGRQPGCRPGTVRGDASEHTPYATRREIGIRRSTNLVGQSSRIPASSGVRFRFR